MGKAISLLVRQQIIALRQQGHGYASISSELNLSYASVRTLCQRYKKEGHLNTHYAHCGKRAVSRTNLIFRAALWLKRLHPLWGAPRIHAKLVERYAGQVPSIRTLNRWYKAHLFTKPKSVDRSSPIGKAKAVHNIWQVDAKEQLTLADGQQACYLTITDEKSGAWLASLVFSLWLYLSSTP